MSSEPGSGSWWTPSWRRLVGSTVVLFVVILALLVGRVRAGADPGLASQTTQAPQPQTAAPGFGAPGTGSSGSGSSGSGSGGVDPQSGQGVDPNDPFADPQSGQGVDPGTGSTDNFGNAVPDGQGSAGTGSDGSGQGTQSVDPPSTHVS
jgi:hypothetical protein